MKAFQLKIVIKNSKPPIWRRVVVPAGITFSQLSMILNKAMGWSGYHLFEFEFYHDELRIIERADEFCDDIYTDFDYLEASTTYVREFLEENEWFTYTYDLGDDWQHRVTIEKILTDYEHNYPQVIKYKGNCPIEDCGGIYGYYECLDIINDENNPEKEERLAWMESQGYPAEYNMETVNDEFRETFFYKWGKGEKRPQNEIYEEMYDGIQGLNAVKRDKNKDLEIIQSDKHRAFNSLRISANLLEQLAEMQKKASCDTLGDIFMDYQKSDIADIAKEKGLRGISGCSKEKLIDKLTTHMLQKEVIEEYFLCLTDEELEVFCQIAEGKNSDRKDSFDFLKKLYSAGYIGMLTNGSFQVSRDVYKKYQSFADEAFHERRQKVSYLLCCYRASNMLYGIAPLEIIEKIAATAVSMNRQEILLETVMLPPEYTEFVISDKKVYHMDLYPNDRGLPSVQADKGYYIPTRDEILSLGIKGYLPECEELKRLKRFLMKEMKLDEESAEIAVIRVQCSIRSGGDMQEVIDILKNEEEVMPISRKQVGEMINLLNDLWNQTRMIVNRGFTPSELAEKEKKKRLPVREPAKVISFNQAKKNKVYPNDPCPCGSGKKYKNCCKGKR